MGGDSPEKQNIKLKWPKKAAERAKKVAARATVKKGQGKRKQKRARSSAAKTKRTNANENALQINEITSDECCVCFGTYDEDVTDGNGRVASVYLHCVSDTVDLEEDTTPFLY